MKIILTRCQLIIALVLVLLIIAPQSAQATTNNMPEYNHCTNCLHNATEKKDITAWGVWGYITWTNPNLNGGAWSYHRVAVVKWSPWRFVEWGWQKISTGIRGAIAYDAGSGGVNVIIGGVSAATHRYSIQYDPNTSKYWFYLDGANVYNINANFSSGNAVTGGGETTGVEAMAHTKLYDLRYLKKNANGTFSYVLWGGHINYADDPPYYNTNGTDVNSFYDDP